MEYTIRAYPHDPHSIVCWWLCCFVLEVAGVSDWRAGILYLLCDNFS